MTNSAEFKLSVTRALSDQMAASLNALTAAPLSVAELTRLSHRPGVYQLYHRAELVYVGKADKSLPQRLDRHLAKLSGRLNIDIADVSFTCLYVDEDLDALAPEKMLIGRFRAEGRVPWNFNGFGNNDPGQQRDTTVYGSDHFDNLYPVDLDIPLATVAAGQYPLDVLVTTMKAGMPYLFRYASAGKRPHEDLAQVTVAVPTNAPSADTLFTLIAASIPGWQVTALPGYVILYPEHRSYPSAQRIYYHA